MRETKRSRYSGSKYDSYSKASQRPISMMSVDATQTIPSPYSNYEFNFSPEEKPQIAKQPNRVHREVYRTFVPELEDEEIDERIEGHRNMVNITR